ncbi:MAG: hypothetical protein COX07_09580 [Bacteroidetes bacterium CG23_combo_of_CG06-09_8_20_14_all_32_9]|nr:MAG: hypothetical protein COX07_09580 [Bacteroidetes bacterium CG23_combo_of_CG06-09_8_20_14_all_32_9]
MKAIKFFVLLSFVFTGLNLLSQTLEMDWGETNLLSKNNWYQKIIGSDKDGFFVIRSQGIIGINEENLWLEYYSTTTNSRESSNQVIMPTVSGNPTHYENIFYLNGKIILFSSASNGSRNVLYVSYLNNEGFLKNKPKEIGSIPISNSNTDRFKFQLTGDGNIMLNFHNTFAQYNAEPFTYKIINPDLIEEFNASLELPLKGRSFEVIQSKISKAGDVCMLIKAETVVNKKKATTGLTYEYIMMIYTVKRKEFHPFPITVSKYIPTNIIFGLDKNDDIVITGFFANKTVKIANEFSGSFFCKINPRILKADIMDPKKSIKLFSNELSAEFSQKRNGETPDQYFNYVIRNMVFFENGGFAFIAEQEYTTFTIITTPGTKQKTRVDYYFYNDLLVCGVTKEGVLDWQIRIPKNQNSSDDNGYYHSIATFVDANKLKIIYNDNRSNLQNKVAEKTKELKNNPVLPPKGHPVIVTLYSDGSYEKYSMFKNEDAKFVIVPRLIDKVGKRYVTYAQDGKSIKFGSFVFE